MRSGYLQVHTVNRPLSVGRSTLAGGGGVRTAGSIARRAQPTHVFVKLGFATIVLISLWEFIPEFWVKNLRPFGLNVENLLIGLAIALFGLSFFAEPRPFDWSLLVLSALFLFMAAIGWMDNSLSTFSSRQFALDALIFAGLLVGVGWGRYCPIASLVKLLTIIGYLAMIGLPLTLALLLSGRLGVLAGGNQRLYVYSLFALTGTLSAIVPVLTAASGLQINGRRPRWTATWTFAGVSLVFAAAAVSATRCVLAQAILGGLFSVLALPRGYTSKRRRRHPLAVGVLAILALGAYVYTLTYSEGTLGERLRATELSSEARTDELDMMFDQLRGHMHTGLGFGHYYRVDARISLELIAAAPHVAIFTPLEKAGVGGFAVCVVLPLFVCASGMIRFRRYPLVVGFSSGLLLWMLFASVSGGWTYLGLFLCGLSWSVALRLMRQVEASKKRPCSNPTFISA